MPVEHKSLIMNGMKFPLKGVFNASRQGNFTFEIFKKSIDVGKDLIRTNVQWMSRLHRILPLLGLIIGLTSFTLQTVIIILDRNRHLPTKIAATFIFLSMMGLAIGGFVLADSAPIVATALALAISILNFSVDLFKFFSNLYDYRKNKHNFSQITKEDIKKERLKRDEQLLSEQAQLAEQLKEQLRAFRAASEQADEKLNAKIIKQIHIILFHLVKKNEKIQSICSPEIPLQREIAKQSQELTIAAIALTINVLSLSLVTFCLATSGTLPIGVSLLLCVNLVIDLAELSKNIIARCRENQRCQHRNRRRVEQADKLLDQAILDLEKQGETSYHQILKAMPREISIDETSLTSVPTPKPTKSLFIPNQKPEFELQLTQGCSLS